MPTITLKLPAGLAARLNTVVRRRSTTKSAVVRQALEAHLEDSARDEDRGSCLDLARDLAGSLRGGPRDLSSNKRHLRGYGR